MGRVSESVGTLLSVGKDLEQSLNNLAADRAIVAANERVQQIRQETGKDAEAAMQQMTQLSQDLSMRLGQLNQPASKIGAITGQLAPSIGAQFQAQENQAAQERSQAFQAGQNTLNRQAQLKAADIRQTREDEKFRKSTLTRGQRDFRSQTKKMRESIQQSEVAKGLLDSKNPIVTKAIQTFMARATGEVGNLTEAERSTFGGSQAIMSRLKRMAQIQLDGTLPEEDANFLRELAVTMGNANKRNLAADAEEFSAGLSFASGLDQEEVLQSIAPEVAQERVEIIEPTAAAKLQSQLNNEQQSAILNFVKKIRQVGGRDKLSPQEQLRANQIEKAFNVRITPQGGLVGK